ncbi:HAD family phosphatase [Microbacterium esteraromaticum]|uniref:HAD family hydrolase n=1 Tax=Microbacterium esteraromaticum TaxID=57043 RepID=UPI001C98D84D|nr:HAD family phosphatase [Microbacterium esteraromaticum]MBY6060622.1 HAD family phosphatase [Microbacterium esteraromaticum]
MIRAVVFDLDGVLRHFDPSHVGEIEARHGLASGSIHSAAFEETLLSAVTRGALTRAEWMLRVGAVLGSPDAAQEWAAHPSEPDESMLALNDELRASGIRTAVLTNGTDTIRTELHELGIASRVDIVFNSAEIGFVKPDVRIFQHVLDALALQPDEVFFTDDSRSKLAGAVSLGIPTHHFVGIDGLRLALHAAGVLQYATPRAPLVGGVRRSDRTP